MLKKDKGCTVGEIEQKQTLRKKRKIVMTQFDEAEREINSFFTIREKSWAKLAQPFNDFISI